MGALKRLREWWTAVPRSIRIFASSFVLLVAAALLWPIASTGMIPIWRIDELTSPVAVVSSDSTGLRLSDGRYVMPKGMAELPARSDTLSIATEHGVEVGKDGAVFGLVKLHHWCGNDPIRYDLRRIDLAQLLAFHHEGKSRLKPRRYAERGFVASGGGGPHGWNTSSYTMMKMVFDPRFAEIFEPVATGK